MDRFYDDSQSLSGLTQPSPERTTYMYSTRSYKRQEIRTNTVTCQRNLAWIVLDGYAGDLLHVMEKCCIRYGKMLPVHAVCTQQHNNLYRTWQQKVVLFRTYPDHRTLTNRLLDHARRLAGALVVHLCRRAKRMRALCWMVCYKIK